MEKIMKKQKGQYKNNNKIQINKILNAAEKLFIEKGIKSTTMSDIANGAMIMRATLYKYFKNMNEVLWALQHRKMQAIGMRIKQNEVRLSTYKKFELYLQILYDGFVESPNDYLFLDLFNEIYQKESTSKKNTPYKQMFKDGDFGSGDSILFLTKNFHDGSVKSELDPEQTAVSIVYGALGILSKFGKNISWMPIKYGFKAEVLIQNCFNLFLEGIKNDKQNNLH